MREKDLSHTPD